jgi:F-type H+-transporting ATPase subunit a
MGEETSFLDLLPGVASLRAYLQPHLARTHFMAQAFPSHFTITHVLGVLLVLLFATIGALVFSRAVQREREAALIPPQHFNLRNLIELFADAVFGVTEGVMGAENARRFLPIIGTLAFFIFFSNALALIPGFIPPTSVLKTNIALALTVFVMTHVYGIREHGLAYFKHFLGPIIWLAPLMLPIEIISHLARPLSLSMRLLGNMAADHKVVAAFFFMIPLLVPIPFVVLGVMVVIIQTLVFCLLSMVYIQGAVAHGHDDAHGDDHGHRQGAH